MFLDTNSYTPDKSCVKTKINNHFVEQKIKFIHKKGKFKERYACQNCQFSGKAQIALGPVFQKTCDCVPGFWKEKVGFTDVPCKNFKKKE